MKSGKRWMVRCGSALAAVANLILAANAALAQDVVCRRASIKGFKDAHRRAQRFLGPETSSLSQMEVFVTVQQDALYLHSNYVTRGFQHPTKIATRGPVRDMRVHTARLVGDARLSRIPPADLLRAFAHQITFYVDQRVFTDASYQGLDFGTALHVHVIGPDDEARRTFPFVDLAARRAQRVVELRPSVYAPLNEPDAASRVARLAGQALKPEELRYLFPTGPATASQPGAAPTSPGWLARYTTGTEASATYGVFFDRLASPDLMLILDDAALTRIEDGKRGGAAFTLYRRAGAAGAVWMGAPVGTLVIAGAASRPWLLWLCAGVAAVALLAGAVAFAHKRSTA